MRYKSILSVSPTGQTSQLNTFVETSVVDLEQRLTNKSQNEPVTSLPALENRFERFSCQKSLRFSAGLNLSHYSLGWNGLVE